LSLNQTKHLPLKANKKYLFKGFLILFSEYISGNNLFS
jgi:hypothetical protein